MKIKIIASLFAVSLLAACGPKSEPAVPVTDSAAIAEPAATTPAPAAVNPVFSVDPASMASCDSIVATVKWDVREKHPGVSDVEILVGPDSAPTLFAAGGSYGEAKTGQWTAPGAIFRLRDKTAGIELERATISGPVCN